jgi:hypothetical protein
VFEAPGSGPTGIIETTLLSDLATRVFSEPPLRTGTPQLDQALPYRGITFGTVFELFGASGCGKSALTARFVRTCVSSALLLASQLQQVPAAESAASLKVHWIVSGWASTALVAATVRDILADTGRAVVDHDAAAAELVGRVLSVSFIASPSDLLAELEACAGRHPVMSTTGEGGGRLVVVVDSIFPIFAAEDLSSLGGVAYASVVGTLRRLVRNLAHRHCAVWVVNGVTSSQLGGGGGGGPRGQRPYGGSLWLTTSDVAAEMHHAACGEDPQQDDAAFNATLKFSLFRPQGVVPST